MTESRSSSPSRDAHDRTHTLEQELERVVDPVVTAMGYELVLVEWAGSGRSRALRVYIDHPEGITVADCARMSPIISSALDAAEADPEHAVLHKVLGPPYVLEVSSPGLDRPLVRRSHFERAIGARAVIKTHAPLDEHSNQKTFHGRILSATTEDPESSDDRAGVIELKDADLDKIHRIPMSLIKRANLVYEG